MPLLDSTNDLVFKLKLTREPFLLHDMLQESYGLPPWPHGWLEPLFPALDLHPIFELRDRYTNTLLSDQLAIHLLQLSQTSQTSRRSSLSLPPPTGYDAQVARWAPSSRACLSQQLDLRSGGELCAWRMRFR